MWWQWERDAPFRSLINLVITWPRGARWPALAVSFVCGEQEGAAPSGALRAGGLDGAELVRSGWCVPTGEVTDLILPFSCSAWCPQGCPRHLWLARLGFGPRCSPPRDAMGTHSPAPACADQSLPPGSSPRAALLCKKQILPCAGLRREPKTLFLMAKVPSVHPGKGFPWCNQTPTASLPGGGTSAGPASPLFFLIGHFQLQNGPRSPQKNSLSLPASVLGDEPCPVRDRDADGAGSAAGGDTVGP